jgi:hypothetical protein
MIARMKSALAAMLFACLWQSSVHAQCAPAPDSPYFFRDLSEERAEAKIAENRKFYDDLLTDSFAARGAGGKSASKAEYITAQLSENRAPPNRRFYSISNYTLIEHRQGHTVATYLLREGITADGKTRIFESQMRETYEVQDGRWRLAAVEASPAETIEAVRAGR